MAKALLKVTVFGGTPPLSIVTKLFKNGVQVGDPILRDGSFDFLFDDLKGNCSIHVVGKNPLGPNGKTIVEISTDEITLNPGSSPNPAERDGEGYHVRYRFTTH